MIRYEGCLLLLCALLEGYFRHDRLSPNRPLGRAFSLFLQSLICTVISAKVLMLIMVPFCMYEIAHKFVYKLTALHTQDLSRFLCLYLQSTQVKGAINTLVSNRTSITNIVVLKHVDQGGPPTRTLRSSSPYSPGLYTAVVNQRVVLVVIYPVLSALTFQPPSKFAK